MKKEYEKVQEIDTLFDSQLLSNPALIPKKSLSTNSIKDSNAYAHIKSTNN